MGILKNICAMSLALLSATMSLSSQKLSVYGEVRPRAELREGYAKPLTEAQSAAFFIQQRSRLGAAFSNSIVAMQVTLQDSRTWGEAAHNADVASVSVYEAWASVLLSPGLTVKAGRQTVEYDSKRIFSAANWSNTGNTHDILTFKYNYNNDFLADMSFAYGNNSGISNESYYTPGMKYRCMGILWFSKQLASPLKLTAIGTVISNQDTISCGGKANYKGTKFYNSFTYGATLTFAPAAVPLKVSAEAYFQSGDTPSGTKFDKLNGHYYAANATYTLVPAINLNVGYEHISGDCDATDDKQSDFKQLFRGNHAFNGSMDYWNSAGKNGLEDIFGGVTLKFNKKKTTLDFCCHAFKTAIQNTSMDGKGLGSELDVTLKHKMNQWFSLEGGYSRYFVNENVRIAKSLGGKATKDANWAYLSFSIKPSVMIGLEK